ncbi:MAG: 3-methyl-2-oxobutanoate hydroxymethyltransferase [Elusimicrobia bacterium]|nr:3-methyl-2-oxobutanoate hydroxymethyltransferase [Elusimicrobiota bacterium]
MKITDFAAFKKAGRRISMITAYDYSMARIAASSSVDCVLVGDSAAMVMHGHESTIAATPELMAAHTAAVARGAKTKFIVADMPFLSLRSGLPAAMSCAGELLRAGADAVKLEGVDGHEAVIKALVHADIPVVGHVGLTPQSICRLGSYRVQGRGAAQAKKILAQAVRLQKLGCFAIVAECVPSALARRMSALLSIPVIGIGSGPHTDGQVLVLHDVLGLYPDFSPKFAKRYCDGAGLFARALSAFDGDVKRGRFPAREHECA